MLEDTTQTEKTEQAEQTTLLSAPEKKTERGVTRSLMSVISGNFLSGEDVLKHLPYLLFLAIAGLLYIANGYYAEETVRKLNKSEGELKELRSEYISTKSELMYKSKQSEVVKIIEEKGLGLKESLMPPKKITVE